MSVVCLSLVFRFPPPIVSHLLDAVREDEENASPKHQNFLEASMLSERLCDMHHTDSLLLFLSPESSLRRKPSPPLSGLEMQ